jgi:hypothetical protein
MLFKSPIFAQASGSVAGLTFSHNRGGQYTRARTTPTDPATARQVAVRAAMTSLTARWVEVLTPVQRDAWANYAANVEMTNRLGDAVFLTGQQHYLRSNLPRVQVLIAPVDAAPNEFDLGLFTPPTFTATSPDDLSVTYDNADDWAGETGSYLFFYSSIQQNPSINYFAGPYRYAGNVAGVTGTPPTPPAALTSTTLFSADNLIFARARVSRLDGRLSGNIILPVATIVDPI